jgi:Holliday junction resolvase RusA-like endonuclease
VKLDFVVPGQPVPKARPRLGKFGKVYTPAKTRAYEQTVRLLGQLAVTRARWSIAVGPCVVTLRLFSASTRRDDVDNCTKAILDALNGVTYRDDSLVDELHVYRKHNEVNPRVEIRIEVLS